MPVRQIVVEPATYQEAVDVTASSVMKEAHRVYGGWAQQLGSLVQNFYDEENYGHWQGLWAIATKCFSAGYHGYSVDAALAVANALAPEFNLAGWGRLEELARKSWDLGTKFSGRKAKQRKKAAPT